MIIKIFLLFLFIAFSSCESLHDIILEQIPDVIYEIRKSEVHKNCEFIKLLNDISAKISHANAQKMKEKFALENEKLLQEIERKIMGNEIFREQIQKLCLYFELKHQLNEAKMRVNGILEVEEHVIRRNIKNAILHKVKHQFGFEKIPENAQSEEWENIKQIVGLMLIQHEAKIVAMLHGKEPRKNGSKIGRKLRIAQVAPILSPYPPRKYGGLERVVSYLTEELVQRGHEVTLISASDSITSARLIFKWHSLLSKNNLELHNESNHWLVDKAHELVRKGQFDVVHIHTECCWAQVEQMVKERQTHVAVTLHYLMNSDLLKPLGTDFTNIPLVSISDDQRTHKPSGVDVGKWNPHFTETIHHGLPAELYKFVDSNEQKRNLAAKGEQSYLAYIGRLSKKKQADVAIRIASKAGTKLKIAGNTFDPDYWRFMLLPLIIKTNLTHKHNEMLKKHGVHARHRANETKMEEMLKAIDLVFAEYKKTIDKHTAPIKEQRSKEKLVLWDYLAKFDQKTLEQIDAHYTEKISEIMFGHKCDGKLDGDRHDLIEFVGEIGDEEKKEFLGNAIAMLFPINWHEPFGIVMIESMAFGTPVITRKFGSVGEVIKPGVSGLIFDTDEEAVEAVKKVSSLDRALVRAEFDHRFTVKQMVNKYEKLFAELIEGKFDKRSDELENVAIAG